MCRRLLTLFRVGADRLDFQNGYCSGFCGGLRDFQVVDVVYRTENAVLMGDAKRLQL